MMMRGGAIGKAADILRNAADTRRPCAPVRELLPDSTIETGYAVQSILTQKKIQSGHRVVGRKIGLTSQAVQDQLGVDQPDFGVLFDDMDVSQQAAIDFTRLLQPRIEAELAFVLRSDLDHDTIDKQTARSAIDFVVPAFEIVDSRIADWNITIVDTIADNASSGLYVLGGEKHKLGDRDLRSVEMTLRDGEGNTLSSGTGQDCLGDPIAALVWLAQATRALGAPLRAGEVVLSGALGPMAQVTPGSTFTAELSGIGSVSATFTSS